jgi:hypothetical protein
LRAIAREPRLKIIKFLFGKAERLSRRLPFASAIIGADAVETSTDPEIRFTPAIVLHRFPVKKLVHCFERDARRSVSALNFSRHSFEQNCLSANRYRTSPKRPLQA